MAHFLSKFVGSPDFITLISTQLLLYPFGCMKLGKVAFGFDLDCPVGTWALV